MEHDDNAHLDNFLQGSQHLMENLQMASGDSVCDNVGDEIGCNIGGKFEEIKVHDDEEEWKYIKEGQQNEKQHQQMTAGIDCNEMDGAVEVGNGYVYAYEHSVAGNDDMPKRDQHQIDNGVDISTAFIADALNSATGFEEKEHPELEKLKNDNDFSTNSNTESTNDESENDPEKDTEQLPGRNELKEDFYNEDKENADPLIVNIECGDNNECTIGNSDFDLEMPSQLNPNAIEFVPQFGSNPSSPIRLTNENEKCQVNTLAFNNNAKTIIQPLPGTIPSHLLGDDDFVAQSPRKGSGESNLDGIALPEENDFGHEAAKRPHELEKEDDLIALSCSQVKEQQQSQLHFDQLKSLNKEVENLINEDCEDYQRHSPINLIDHGPETCVDLDADADERPDNVETVIDESIKDVLNTVQPLPIDINSSCDGELMQIGAIDGKELLDVEKKENIFNSPCVEMFMNIQNELNVSSKDIPQIDMDNIAHMQESFYQRSTSLETQYKTEENNGQDDRIHTDLVEDYNNQPAENNSEPEHIQNETEYSLDGSPVCLNRYTEDSTATQKVEFDNITPSPISTEEKHLVEETKEQVKQNFPGYEVEQKMGSLTLTSKEEILSQVEEVPQTAAKIVESINPFTAPESEKQETLQQSPIEADHPFSPESQQHANFLQQNEQVYYNEQKEQDQTMNDNYEFSNAQHKNDLFLSQPVKQPTELPVKFESELDRFENVSTTPITNETNTTAPFVHEVAASEPHFERSIVETELQLLRSEAETVSLQEAKSFTTLQKSSNIVSNVSNQEEILLTASKTCSSPAVDAIAPLVTDKEKLSANKEVITTTSIGVIEATVAALSSNTKTEKKMDVKKQNTLPTSTKTKALDCRKVTDPIKKNLGTTTKTSVSTASATRPRTAPGKTTATTEKKSTTLAVTKASTLTATRKPLTSTTTSTKSITKPTTARPITAPAADKSLASRTITSTTARGGSAATSNDSVATKPKPGSSAPTKPTTLGLSTTTKPKLSSPRSTLTAQLRKAAPTNTGTGLGSARSPIKTIPPTTNGVSKSLTTTTTASRARSSTSTTATTTTTKTFTARPAPKTTHSTTLSTTSIRRTVGSVSSSSTTVTKTTGSTLQKKTSPGNTRTIGPGKTTLSPIKTSNGKLKLKTKDVPKKAATPTKSTNELKKKPIEEQRQIIDSDVANKCENELQLNGKHEQVENCTHYEESEIDEGSLLKQHVQASLIDA